MKNQDLAKAILDHIGKEENIKNLTHCVTRLRFTLKDRKKADVKYIEQLEGVLGVQEQNGQIQVSVGSKVTKDYQALTALTAFNESVGDNILHFNSKSASDYRWRYDQRLSLYVLGVWMD